MARVTIQDCLQEIENPFTLVRAASHRARKLALGATPYLPNDQHKPTVTALREIAEGLLDEDGELKAIYKDQKQEENSQIKEENQTEIEIGRMLDEGDTTTPASDESASLSDQPSSSEEAFNDDGSDTTET